MIFDGTALFGIKVVVDPHLPFVPSDAENARRIVRHGMADILRWLGQPVGPKPGEENDMTLKAGEVLFVSRRTYDALRMNIGPWGYRDEAKPILNQVWEMKARWDYNNPPRSRWVPW